LPGGVMERKTPRAMALLVLPGVRGSTRLRAIRYTKGLFIIDI